MICRVLKITIMGTNGMRIKIKNIDRWNDRHGKLRLYFRSGKNSRIPLRGPEGSPEFWIDYYAAINGEISPKVKSTGEPSGTMRWLIAQYYKSAEFQQLGNSTKTVRRGILERFCVKHGHKPYAKLERRHLVKIKDSMVATPEAANSLLKALRQVFKVAIDNEYMINNLAITIKYLKPNNKNGFHTWTNDEIEKFEAAHPVGTKARLALALFIFTAQRRGDIVKIGKQHVRNEWLSLTQEKTGISLKIPIMKELRRVIDASPTGDLTFLVTEFNKPFTSNGFGNWFRKQCDKAKLDKRCSAHGLRKASAVRLAHLGCTTQEIMSITGHTTLKEVERYTKDVVQEELAGKVRDRHDR